MNQATKDFLCSKAWDEIDECERESEYWTELDEIIVERDFWREVKKYCDEKLEMLR